MLKTVDYEKVLELASLIQTNKKNCVHHILNSLREVLDYRYISLFFNKHFFLPTTTFFMKNSMIEEIPNEFSSNYFLNNRNFFDVDVISSIDELMPYHVYKNTDYNHLFLEKYKLSDHLFLPLKTENTVIGFIGIHKTKDHHGFTAREKQICIYASKFIGSNFTKMFEIEQLKYSNSWLVNSISTIPVGILVLDSEYSLLYHNEKAKHYGFDIVNLHSAADLISSIKDLVAAKNPNLNNEFELIYKQFLLKVKTLLTLNSRDVYEKQFVINIYPQSEQEENSFFNTCIKLGLSKREAEIIELVSKGDSNHAIAKKLFLSVNTVKTHINNVFNKLGVNNRMSVINKIKNPL